MRWSGWAGPPIPPRIGARYGRGALPRIGTGQPQPPTRTASRLGGRPSREHPGGAPRWCQPDRGQPRRTKLDVGPGVSLAKLQPSSMTGPIAVPPSMTEVRHRATDAAPGQRGIRAAIDRQRAVASVGRSRRLTDLDSASRPSGSGDRWREVRIRRPAGTDHRAMLQPACPKRSRTSGGGRGPRFWPDAPMGKDTRETQWPSPVPTSSTARASDTTTPAHPVGAADRVEPRA